MGNDFAAVRLGISNQYVPSVFATGRSSDGLNTTFLFPSSLGEVKKEQNQSLQKPWYLSFGKEILKIGTVVGASILGGFLFGPIGAIAFGGIASGLTSAADQALTKGQVDSGTVLIDTLLGAIPGGTCSLLGRLGSRFLASAGKEVVKQAVKQTTRKTILHASLKGAVDGGVIGYISAFLRTGYEDYKTTGVWNFSTANDAGLSSILLGAIGGGIFAGGTTALLSRFTAPAPQQISNNPFANDNPLGAAIGTCSTKPLSTTGAITGTQAAKVVPLKTFSEASKINMSLIQVGGKTPPSKEFQAAVSEATEKLLQSLPANMRQKLLEKGFKVQVYHSSDELMDSILTLSDLLSKESLESAMKIVKSQRNIFSGIFDWGRTISPAQLQNEVFQMLRKDLKMACGIYADGSRQIYLFEFFNNGLETTMSTSKAFDLLRLLRHELGHYVDDFENVWAKRAMNSEGFKKAIQTDLDAASASQTIPIISKGNGVYDVDRIKLKVEFDEMQRAAGKALSIAEHYLSYTPLSIHEQQGLRGLNEAFAEIFAAMHGGGALADPSFITEKLYPQTAKYIREVVLPALFG